MKVHQSTVDTYLEDVILSSVDKTADQQVRGVLSYVSYCEMMASGTTGGSKEGGENQPGGSRS